jgi:hypothetical protein
MKALTSLLIAVVAATSLSGCIIRTRDRHHHHHQENRARCAPGYHWERGACVHNGRHRR